MQQDVPEFAGPMSPAAWAEIPPAKKQQMLVAYHESIIQGARDHVKAALIQSLESLIEKGGKPNQALAIVAQWDDPVLKDLPSKIRKKCEKKIKGKKYIVLPWERDLWTGGPGAPDWSDTHPYKGQMIRLCSDPDEGKLWVVSFSGASALSIQLGDQPANATGMENIVMASDAPVEDEGETVANETLTDEDLATPSTPSTPRTDPFET